MEVFTLNQRTKMFKKQSNENESEISAFRKDAQFRALVDPWLKKGPWRLGRVAVFTNAERYHLLPVEFFCRTENVGPLWDEWGVISFGFRLGHRWLRFRVAIGSKVEVIPRWMKQ